MLTYAVEHVGVQHVVIVGHTNCGGCHACHAAAQRPPSAADSPLARWLGPLTEIARANPEADLTTLAEENVKMGVSNLVKSEVIRGAWAAGKEVEVHGWVYELESGRVRDLGCSRFRD